MSFYSKPFQGLRILESTPAEHIWGKGWRLYTLEVKRIRTREEAKSIRNQLPGTVAVKAELLRLARKTQRDETIVAFQLNNEALEAHHVFPLILGGTNANLVLVPRAIHSEIHAFINQQIDTVGLNFLKQIEIPGRQDLLLWSAALRWGQPRKASESFTPPPRPVSAEGQILNERKFPYFLPVGHQPQQG